jgi:hypothetical protein
MSDTISSLIDKLITINLKIRHNQDLLEKYIKSPEKTYNLFQVIADLYLQREQLILEITEMLSEIIGSNTDLDNGKYIQRKHKTY